MCVSACGFFGQASEKLGLCDVRFGVRIEELFGTLIYFTFHGINRSRRSGAAIQAVPEPGEWTTTRLLAAQSSLACGRGEAGQCCFER